MGNETHNITKLTTQLANTSNNLVNIKALKNCRCAITIITDFRAPLTVTAV